MLPVIAVPAAIAASVTFGASAVMEQRSAKRVPERGPVAPRMLLDLARQPLWLAAIGATLAGLVLQLVALRFGPLALVQPILAFDLLFAVLIAAATIRHRPPDKTMLLGVLCCACGVGGFLAAARPHGDTYSVSLPEVLPLAAALAAVLAICFAIARRGTRHHRALALALACGVTYGVTAFLYKLLAQAFSHGISELPRQWPLYAVIVVGPVGFLLNQSAFQADVLISPVLSVITATDPLVSIAVAHLWLNEKLAGGGLAVTAEVVSLGVMIAGIAALAHRAPQAARQG
jgi:drug/metabolite transporter (DMT)-like permease